MQQKTVVTSLWVDCRASSHRNLLKGTFELSVVPQLELQFVDDKKSCMFLNVEDHSFRSVLKNLHYRPAQPLLKQIPIVKTTLHCFCKVKYIHMIITKMLDLDLM